MQFSRNFLVPLLLTTPCLVKLASSNDPGIHHGYWTVDRSKNYLYSNFTQMYRRQTRIGCARKCFKTKYCTGFAYVKNIRFCYVYVHTEIDGPNNGILFDGLTHYRKRIVNCPLNAGYMVSNDEEVCLRIYTTRKNHARASEKCQQDGGHLYIMDSVFKQNMLKRIVNAPSDEDYFLGAGEIRDGETSEFRWLNGRIVEPSMWNPNEVFNHNAQCVVVRSFDLPFIGVTNCGLSAWFVCEVS